MASTPVALFTRAWIEIIDVAIYAGLRLVALFTRAWIEIFLYLLWLHLLHVALFTRAWIEMAFRLITCSAVSGRPLHEGVD